MAAVRKNRAKRTSKTPVMVKGRLVLPTKAVWGARTFVKSPKEHEKDKSGGGDFASKVGEDPSVLQSGMKWAKQGVDAAGKNVWKQVPKTASAPAAAAAPSALKTTSTQDFGAMLAESRRRNPTPTVKGDPVRGVLPESLAGWNPVDRPIAVVSTTSGSPQVAPNRPDQNPFTRGVPGYPGSRGQAIDDAILGLPDRMASGLEGLADRVVTGMEKLPIVQAAENALTFEAFGKAVRFSEGAMQVLNGIGLQAAGALGSAVGAGPHAYEISAQGRYDVARGMGGDIKHVDKTLSAPIDFALREASGLVAPEEYGALANELDWYGNAGVGKIVKQLATNKALSAAGAMDWNSAYERKLALDTLAAGGDDPLGMVGDLQKASALAEARRAAGLPYNEADVKNLGDIVGQVFGRAGVEARQAEQAAIRAAPGYKAPVAPAKPMSAAQIDLQSKMDFEASQKANESAYKSHQYGVEKIAGNRDFTQAGIYATDARRMAIDVAQKRVKDYEANQARATAGTYQGATALLDNRNYADAQAFLKAIDEERKAPARERMIARNARPTLQAKSAIGGGYDTATAADASRDRPISASKPDREPDPVPVPVAPKPKKNPYPPARPPRGGGRR